MKQTQKFLAVVLSVIMILSVLSVIPFTAFAETEGIFTYEVSDYGATVTGITNKSYKGILTIPYTLGGYPVVSIGNSAFYCCSGITSIVMPDTITSFGNYAFGECSKLTSVTFPQMLATIGYNAFRRCKLTTINISKSVVSIANEAFYECDNIESITVDESNPLYCSVGNCLITKENKTIVMGCKSSIIPSDGSVVSIGLSAFSGCKGLNSITIPSPIKTIEALAFDSCTNLKSVVIGNSVTDINDWAFAYCKSLEEITVDNGNTVYHSEGDCLIDTANKILVAGCNNSIIPSDGSVISIGNWAFWYREGLVSIEIPYTITSIGRGAFCGCSALTSIEIPSSVIYIDSEAFEYCTGLSNIKIPCWLNSIEARTFYRCTSLASITIPKSVQYIGQLAFSECKKLKDVYYTGTEEQKSNVVISTEEGNNPYEDANCYLLNADWHCDYVVPCSHTRTTTKNYKVATCNSLGYTGDTVCIDCGVTLSTGTTIPATGVHTMGTPVNENIVSATCTADGSYDEVVYCTVCGILLSSTPKTIPATGVHTCGDWIIDKKATLTETGLKHKECTVCGETVDTQVIPVIDQSSPQIVVESKKARAGKTVDVNISLKNNPGITSAKIKVNFPAGLTLEDVNFGDIGGMTMMSELDESPVTLNWFIGNKDLKASDIVFGTLTFKVAEDALTGTKDITVEFDPDDIFDITNKLIDFVAVDGGIEVIKYEPGDITDDGKVNNQDLVLLFQYLSGWDVEVNEAALDINGDGKENNQDLVLLFQFLSGWSVEIF